MKITVKENNAGGILVYLYDGYTEYATIYEDINKDCLNLLKDFISGKSYCSDYDGNVIPELEEENENFDISEFVENFDENGGDLLLEAEVKKYDLEININKRFFELIYL